MQFDFENNKKLMMKIKIETKEEKETETRKKEKPNKEVKEIITKKKNITFKFKIGFFKLN